MKHFGSPALALDWALEELAQTLRDDLNDMQANDDDPEREAELEDKIADIEEMATLVNRPIIVTISGGNVQDVTSPASLDVEVRDYDNGEDESIIVLEDGTITDDAEREYGRDEDGKFYSVALY